MPVMVEGAGAGWQEAVRPIPPPGMIARPSQRSRPVPDRNSAYRIEGGRPVVGEITCLGAKNFVTKAMVASILGRTETTLTNVPPIGDVSITGEMLSAESLLLKLRYQQAFNSSHLRPNPVGYGASA